MTTSMPADVAAFLLDLEASANTLFKEQYVGGCASCMGSTPRLVYRDEKCYQLAQRLKAIVAAHQLHETH